MRQFFNYVPSDDALRRGKWTVILLFVAVLLVAVWAVLWLAHENDILDERDRQSLSDREDLRRDLNAEQAAREALEEQIRQLGERPVVEPEDVPDDAQVVIVPGPRGPSCIEAIGYARCRGDAGANGRPGADGSDGADGVDGRDGADSTVPGPAGKDGANGKDGRDGAPGKDGSPGRGITDAQCRDDGRWLITYTDGTTSDGGVCRVVPPGNPGGTQ